MKSKAEINPEGDMKGKRFGIHLVIVLSMFLAAAPASALTGDEILAKVDAVLSAPTDGTSTAKMVLEDKNGKTKERSLQLWTRYYKDKDDWSLSKFVAPAEVRDLGFLSLADDKMYLYLPAFDRVRRIASHARKESFAGSDLSNDDLSTGRYVDHFSAKVTKETEEEYVLELTRKPGSNRIYPRSVVWVNKQNFTIPKMELFDKNDRLWKTFEGEYAQIQGYWTMTSLTMTDVQKKHKTVMTMEDIQFDVGLDEKTFTQRYLKRRVKVD
jgi:outer membrane lipoprotein-sorting protein